MGPNSLGFFLEPQEFSGACGGGSGEPPLRTCCLATAGWLRKLGKLISASAFSIPSRKGGEEGADGFGWLDQMLKVNPTSAGPQ